MSYIHRQSLLTPTHVIFKLWGYGRVSDIFGNKTLTHKTILVKIHAPTKITPIVYAWPDWVGLVQGFQVEKWKLWNPSLKEGRRMSTTLSICHPLDRGDPTQEKPYMRGCVVLLISILNAGTQIHLIWAGMLHELLKNRGLSINSCQVVRWNKFTNFCHLMVT